MFAGEHHSLTAIAVLFSGGNDSTVLAHMFKDVATHAVHANTGIGIEATRQFVRDTCAMWDLPLLERRALAPQDQYEAMVLERGFPGPAMHWKMYQRLKERALEQVRKELNPHPRKQRAIFLAGRRSDESKRRSKLSATIERRGSLIWVSPILDWTSVDMNTYRAMHPDIPRNQVSDLLHMSGECLCGAFAKPGELDEIGYWYPDVVAQIRGLEGRVRAAGHPPEICRWGHGVGRRSKVGPLCSSCAAPPGEPS